MLFSPLTAVSVLVIFSICSFIRSGRSRTVSVFYFSGMLISISLALSYVAADSFTSEGIDSATIFHLHYGFKDAGLGEYHGLIAIFSLALVFSLLALAVICFSGCHRPRRYGFLALAFLLLAGSLMINPGAADIIRMAKLEQLRPMDFQKYYRTPELRPISPEHPNFIYIYAESLERTYFDEAIFPGLITQLRTLENQAISFTNIVSVFSTRFTMGGIVASQSGIPLVTPTSDGNAMADMDTFLPAATGLGNLLHSEGYYLAFMGGASRHFAGKAKFLKSREFDSIDDYETLQPYLSDQTYRNTWGLYDDTLFDLAYERFVRLSAEKKRFGLFLLTLETHHPNGFLSKSMTHVSYRDGSNLMLNAVASSDQQIGRFVHRIRNSSQGKNTVIVIASDHISFANSTTPLLQRGTRRNLFFILPSHTTPPRKIDRKGSTLDAGVTLLPFLGYKGSIGLGRDLLDPDEHENDASHIQNKETLLSWRAELAKFWNFPQYTRSIEFHYVTSEVTIDGRNFKAPLQIEFAPHDQTLLHFGNQSPKDSAYKPGTNYLWITRKTNMDSFVFPLGVKETPWVLIIGKVNGGSKVFPVVDGFTFKRKAMDRYFEQFEADFKPPIRSSAGLVR